MALLALFLSSCWLFICSSFFRVLKLVTTVFPFRLSGEDGSFDCLFLKSWNNGNSDFSKKICFNTKEEEKEDGISERDQIDLPISKNEFLINRVDDDRIPEKKLSFESEESESTDFEKVLDTKHQIMNSEEPSYSFRFQFQTDKDLKQRLEELEIEGLDGWFSETNSSDVLSDNREKSNNCFEFLSEKDFRDSIAESSVGSNSTHDFDTNLEDEFLSDNDFLEIDLRKETEDFLIDEDGFKNSFSNEETLDFLSEKDFRRSKSNPETKKELFEARTGQSESRTEQSETRTERCETPMDPLTDSDGENPDWVDDFEKNEDTQDMDYDYEKEEDDGLEILWEHQDLLEQLRTELGKVRAVGLPTILEDSECPKFTDDLKPWKIDQKFLKEDRMGELQKFYKSYSERMRKLDIFNYQKMYAIGFLKLKDPPSKATSHRDTFPAKIRRNLRLCRGRKLDADPSAKVMRELEGDLETVYVGQTCLSWEILHWQYLKAEELMDSDPQGSRRYDDVAGELQRFQVLLDRFLENEPFQGPTRVENYVRNRCVLRNLLQVPLKRRKQEEKEESTGLRLK